METASVYSNFTEMVNVSLRQFQLIVIIINKHMYMQSRVCKIVEYLFLCRVALFLITFLGKEKTKLGTSI